VGVDEHGPQRIYGACWLPGTRATTGYNATLQANALTGLATVRDVLVTYATNHHLTSCNTISDADLTAFASETTSAARVTAAQALFDTCNAACAAP
jgi:hypothetical protein